MKTTTKENLAIGGIAVGALLASVALPNLVNRSLAGPYEGDSYRVTSIDPTRVFNQEMPSKFGMLRSGEREVWSIGLEGIPSEIVVDRAVLPETIGVGDCLQLNEIKFGDMRRSFTEATRCSKAEEPNHDVEKRELERLNNDMFRILPFL